MHDSHTGSDTLEISKEFDQEDSINSLHAAIKGVVSRIDVREKLAALPAEGRKVLPSTCVKGLVDSVSGRLLGIVDTESDQIREQDPAEGVVPAELHISVLRGIGKFAIRDISCQDISDVARRNLYDIAGRLNMLENERS